jgi:hypothetical protein
MSVPPPPGVVWVKVEKPVFDIVGVLVSSLTFTGLLVLGALACGGLLALVYILRGRHFGSDPQPSLQLGLGGDTRSG